MPRPLFSQKLAKQVVRKQDLEPENVDFALTYLSYYFHDPALGALTEEKIKEYVREFQSYTGMAADGELDPQVVKAMQWMPRCGCKDYTPIGAQAAGVPSWGLKEITYYIEKWVTGISQVEQATLLQTAFDAWSKHGDIRARRVNSPNGANIIVSTGRGQGDQFDGPSGTLAWAYLPPQPNFRGQLMMRFDIDETWIVQASDRGILYLNVATHEIGHLLGLDHSKKSKALMAPYYAVGIVKPQADDDVSRIIGVYGAATTPVPPPTNPPPTNPPTGGKLKVEIMVNSMADIKISGRDLVDFSLI